MEEEFDTMEECISLIREAQSKLNQLKSKEEQWNKDVRSSLDDICIILSV